MRHAAGHDHADIAGAEDYRPAAHHDVLQVDQVLGRPGRVNPGRPGSGNTDGPGGPLAAAHGQHHGSGLDACQSPSGTHVKPPPAVERKHDGTQHGFDPQRVELVYVALGVFRTGQGLAEAVQSESVVDALVEDSAQEVIAFDQ